MKNILVGIDFLNNTQILIEHAYIIAEATGSKVWLIHIASPDPDFVSFEAGPQSERNLRAEKLKKEKKLLEQYANLLQQKGVESDGLMIQGATIQTLLDKTVELNIDLIVLGHHKHGLLFNAFFGSTSKKIMDKSALPILVVPLNTA